MKQDLTILRLDGKKGHIDETKLRNKVKEITKKIIFEARNKRGVINEFYKLVYPYTTKRFRDNSWQNVRMILDTIGEWADDINVWVENGGYGHSPDGMSSFKDWQIEFVKDGIECRGYLRANACGTMQDEWDSYDVTIIIW